MTDVDVIHDAGPDAIAAARKRREEYARVRHQVMEAKAAIKKLEKREDELFDQVVEDFLEHGTGRFDVHLDEVELNGETGPLDITLTLGDDVKISARTNDLLDEQNEEVDAGTTAYARRRVVDALRALRLEQYVQPETFNWSGLRSYVASEIDAGRELPEVLAAALVVHEGNKINVRRTRKQAAR